MTLLPSRNPCAGPRTGPPSRPSHHWTRPSPGFLARVLAVVAATPVTLAAQVSFGGQVRPRFEAWDTDDYTAFTSMRTRVHLSAVPAPDVRVFVQLQDVRTWGEETNTLGDYRADALDLHQGFVEAGREGHSALWVRAGRQEVSLGGERLVGAVGWTQQGRAFDGVRGALLGGRTRVDLFGFQVGEEQAGRPADAAFLGGLGTFDLGGARRLGVYALHDRDGGPDDLERTTLGGRLVGAPGGWTYRLEGYWQTGSLGGLDVAAWMAGARLGRVWKVRDGGYVGLTLWYDHLSGDQDAGDEDLGVFHTLYATNHKFYGYADLFLDIPAHTAGHGLRDMAVKTFWDLVEDVRVSLDLHEFRAAETGALAEARFADEVDLTARWAYDPHLALTAGLSRVFRADGLVEIDRLDGGVTFGYLMVDATF